MSRHNAPFKFQVFSMAKFMNARCQCSIVVDALQFTDKTIQQHDVIKFTGKDALTGLDVDCVKQDKAAFMSVLNGCTNLRKLKYNQRIHAYVNEMGAMIDSDTATSLVNTYVKSGNIEEAHAIFYQMDRPEVLSWNIVIGGYVNHGYAREALCLFSRMQKQGMKPDEVTMVHILNACASLEDVEHGKKVHACIINGAVQPNVYVFNALIDMYVKCSNITIALQVFEEEHERNVVSCNALMAGYSKLGPAEECFHLLGRMEQEGIKPNEVTFVYILKACASLGNLDLGKQLHRHILKSRLKLNVFMGNGLMDMYCKCGDIVLAGQVFNQMAVRDVVSWNVIMAGYAKHGPSEVVFNLFEKMERAGVRPSAVTFLCLLNTCASLGDLDRGKKIHAEVLKTGLKQDINMWNTLIDMYSKCGSIKDARQLFDKMPRRDVVSWNVMITGYAKEGPAEKAFGLLRKIQQEGVKLNDDTYVSLLNACASLGALERGQHIHSQAIQDGLGFDAFVGSALVDMYAKSGSLDDAFHVLGKLPERDTVTWNALISGYALFGCCQTVVQLVNRMQKEDMELNHVTILALLSACSYAGLIHEGYKLFDHMTQHGYAATMEHNACIVDLLGRAGCLEEAVGFVENMPCQPGVSVWLSLLGACRVYGHVELAKFITNCFLNLEPKTIGNFVLLSNIYATAARWDEGRGHIGNSIMFL